MVADHRALASVAWLFDLYTPQPRVYILYKLYLYQMCHIMTNIQSGSNMGMKCTTIENVLLALTFMKIWEFLAYNECQYINLLMSWLNIGHKLSTKYC